MKYVLAFKSRANGSAAENEAAQKRSLQLLAKYEPSMTVREWTLRLDGEGGFSVIEGDDPVAILRDVETWSPLFEFTLYPVVDITDGAPALQEAVDFRDSIT